MESIGIAGIMSLVGTGVSTVAQMSAASAAAQQDANNAAIADANAKQALFESTVAAQDNDFQANLELGAFIAGQGASGLNLGSGSAFLQRRTKQELASKDRARIEHSGEIDKTNLQAQAADYRASASAKKRSGTFSAISGALDLGSSYISSAAKVKKRKATTITGKSGT